MIWPIHPQPFQDELLSSWMLRIAHANKYKIYDFYSSYLGCNANIWTRDIDVSAQQWLIEALNQYTGTNVDIIKGLTLAQYEGSVFERLHYNGITKGVLSVGVYHRTRRQFGLQVCPLCLAENGYYKSSWRLAYLTVCPIHKVLLHDRCEVCGKPFAPHRADMIKKSHLDKRASILKCSHCQSPIGKFSLEKENVSMVNFQQKLFDCIKTGYYQLPNERVINILFFEGLRALIAGFERLNYQSYKGKKTRFQFELSKLKTRHSLLKQCQQALEKWPESFHEVVEGKRQIHSSFVSKNLDGTAPYWVSKVTMRHSEILGKNPFVR